MMKAVAEVTRLQPKLAELELAQAEAEGNLNKAKSDLAELENQLQKAKKMLKKANASCAKAEKSKGMCFNILLLAREDERTDYERVLDSLSLSGAHTCGAVFKHGKDAMLDVCDMHRAGHVDDEQLVMMAEQVATTESIHLQVGALDALGALSEQPP